MKSTKQAFIKAILFLLMVLLLMLPSQLEANEKQWVVFNDNIPQDIERFNIMLEYTPSRSYFYDGAPQYSIKSKDIEGKRKKDDYKQQLDFGTAVDGNQYVVMVKDASDIDIINQNSDRLCRIKVVRIKNNKKTETVTEGLLSLQRDFEIPLEISPEQINIPFQKPVEGVLEINIYSSNYPVYEGRCRTKLKGTLSGSTSIKNTFINATITCKSSAELKERYLNLSLKPFDSQMASSFCKGEISDILTLGSANLIVEKMASDSSELVLALLDGELEVKEQDNALLAIGRPFPAFARVELIKRRLLTLDDLRKEAGTDGYIVLIFGDIKRVMTNYYGGQSYMRSLSLDEMMISDILKKDCEKPIVMGFVCQQLSLSDLYEKWIGRDPEFYVFSDFSNPLDMQFVDVGMEQHMYHPSPLGNKETLRGKFKFANEKVITALIDGNGELVYLNTDAGGELAGSLVQINNLIKARKKAEHEEQQD